MDRLAKRLAAKKVVLSASPAGREYLTNEGYSKEFGARNIARTIEEKLANELVDEVLFGKLEKGGKVLADIKDNKIIFEIN